MKKVLIGIAAIAGVGCLIGPNLIGNKADDQLLEMVSTINDIPGYSLTLKERQKGWYSSQNVLEFAVDMDELVPEWSDADAEMQAMFDTLKFEIMLDLSYGPVLGREGLGLVAWHAHVPNVPDMITILDQTHPGLYHMHGKQSFTGTIAFEDAVPAFEVSGEDLPGKIQFSGWAGAGKPVGDQMQYVSEMQSLTVESPNADQVSAKALSLEWLGSFDLKAWMSGAYGESKMKLTLGEFLVTEGGENVAALKGLSMFGDTTLSDNNAIDLDFGYGAEKVKVPHGEFEDIELAFEMNNLSVKFLQEYQEITSDIDNVTNPEKMIPVLTDAAIEALAFEPELIITNIGVKTPEGQLTSSASLKLSDYAVTKDKVMDTVFWGKNVLVESDIRLPKAMAFALGEQFVMSNIQKDPAAAALPPEQIEQIAKQQIEPMFEAFKQQGLLVEEGDLIKLSFNLKEGLASLNGKPVPLPGLMP